jgi:hypothetical protein
MSPHDDDVGQALRRLVPEIDADDLPRTVLRRIRVRQVLMVSLTISLVLTVGLGGFIGFRTISDHAPRPLASTPAPRPSLSAASLPCTSAWTVTPGSLMAGDTVELLKSVAASSPSDVWAVGSRYAGGDQRPHPIVAHWDGSAWDASSGADLGGKNASLAAVASVAPDDVWAVGQYEVSRQGPLVEHWDGHTWSVSLIPDIGSGQRDIGRGLVAISAAGPNDIWTLGYYQPVVAGESVSRDVFGHWNGKAWSVVSSPQDESLTGTSAMQDISAAGPNDAWAVGGRIRGFSEAGTGAGALVQHWDGQGWTRTAPPEGDAPLLRVAALSDDSVWVVRGGGSFRSVGSYGSFTNGSQVLVWDGQTWNSSLREPRVEIAGITAIADNDVWVVGSDSAAGSPYIAHWDGSSWTRLPSGSESPRLSGGAPWLTSVTHADRAVVAVGSQYQPDAVPETRLWKCGPDA